MRFMLLTPGTGHFYCGSCLRDNVLGRALQARGHEVEVVPLYLPLVLEEGAIPAAGRSGGQEVLMGGINLYLQQKTRLARRLPRWLANLLDNPTLLRWASRRGNLTEARALGAMTLSMLQGEHGRQAHEVEKLVQWATTRERPDVVVLSNIMLSGTARRLKQALHCPVVSSLQGEAPFLDAMPAPFKEQAWQTLSDRAADIDAFLPVSHSYGDLMRERLALTEQRLHVVQNGIDLADFCASPLPLADRRPRTIGYLARMCREKGLATLVDAFVLLKQRGDFKDLRLRVAGVVLKKERPLVRELQNKLQARGVLGHAEFLPNVSRSDKLALLASLSVLSVPATYGESFGLYLLEAMAAGVPVVQPRCAAFPELLEATGGGVLCQPDDPASLADALALLLLDEPRAQDLADRGRHAVREQFTADRMAGEIENVCRMIAR